MLLFVGPWLWVLLQSFNASLNSPITGVGTDLEPPLADKDDARPGTPTTGGKITYKSWTLNPWVIGQAAIWRVLKAHVKHFNFKPLLCLQTALDFFCLCWLLKAVPILCFSYLVWKVSRAIIYTRLACLLTSSFSTRMMHFHLSHPSGMPEEEWINIWTVEQ